MKMKPLVLAATFLLLSVFAAAQCGVDEQNLQTSGPNTGLANTLYSTDYFSVIFNGPVTAEAFRSTDNRSTNYVYSSSNANVVQMVNVRILDGDIPNDRSSAEFYANDDRTPGEDLSSRTDSYFWCGHPYVYTTHVYPLNGRDMRERSRIIIVNSRTVIFLVQIAPDSYSDHDEWLDFEYSLRTK
jgi:hypothetical protein